MPPGWKLIGNPLGEALDGPFPPEGLRPLAECCSVGLEGERYTATRDSGSFLSVIGPAVTDGPPLIPPDLGPESRGHLHRFGPVVELRAGEHLRAAGDSFDAKYSPFTKICTFSFLCCRLMSRNCEHGSII